MEVKSCNYYAFRRGKTYKKSPLAASIKECFSLNSRWYGSRRIALALKIGRNTVRKVLKIEGLKAIQPKSFKPNTTDSKHGFGFNENLLKDLQNEPNNQGEVFIGDITYLRLQSGVFCYLAVLQDKFTRRIVGWKVSERMTAQFVIDVFNQARSEIFSYIEGYYNRTRIHSSIGKSPAEFEAELKIKTKQQEQKREFCVSLSWPPQWDTSELCLGVIKNTIQVQN